MGNSSSSISPLRQRMIDDMTMRRLGLREVKGPLEYLNLELHK